MIIKSSPVLFFLFLLSLSNFYSCADDPDEELTNMQTVEELCKTTSPDNYVNFSSNGEHTCYDGIANYCETVDSISLPDSQFLRRQGSFVIGTNILNNWNVNRTENNEPIFQEGIDFQFAYGIDFHKTFLNPGEEEISGMSIEGSITPFFISKEEEARMFPQEVVNYYDGDDEDVSFVTISFNEITDDFLIGEFDGFYIDFYTEEKFNVKGDFKIARRDNNFCE